MFCTKCGSQIGNEYHFCSTCWHKTRSELTDSVPLQFQGSICEKDVIRNYFQAGYTCEVILMFLRVYHNINSKRTLERNLRHSLKTNYGIIVRRDIVLIVLKEIDPEGTNMRKARRLRRRKYVSEGSNSCWHADGYDKLKPCGFPIHGCIDRYSRRISWLKVTKSNSHANVPAAYYVDTMKELGVCPKLLQTDCGTENVLMAAIQSRLQ